MKQIKVYKGHERKHYEQFEDTIKYMPKNDYDIFLRCVKDTEDKNRVRNKLIIQLLLSSGCRIYEFSQIKVADIDFKNETINIPWENTKTKKNKVVRINREVMLDLKEYLQTNNIKSGFIFQNKKTKKPLSSRNYNLIIDKYYNVCKEQLTLDFKPHAHTFRHSHVVFALQNGVPINAVMQQVGHLDIKTTQIYSKLAGVDIKESYKEVDF